MYSLLKFLHLAGAMVWLGGMTFMLFALRPSLPLLETPAQRLPLLAAVLRRFFVLVWAAIAVLLLSGFYMFGHAGAQAAPVGWHGMAGIGTLMVLIFGHIYFALYRPMVRAIATADWAQCGRRANLIAKLVMLNFVLGWFAVAAIVFLA
jgi:uncharacterized membrane protein